MLKGFTSKLAQYPRLRVLLIVVVMIVIFIVVLNIMSSGDVKNNSDLPPSRVQQGGAQGTEPVSQERAQQYNKLNQKVDKQQLQQKVEHGQTVLNNVFNSADVKQTDTFSQKQAAHKNGHLKNTHKILSPQQFAQSQKAQSEASANSKLALLSPENQADQVFHNPKLATTKKLETQQQAVQQAAQLESESIQSLQSAYRTAISTASSGWNLPKMGHTQGAAPPTHKMGVKAKQIPKTVVKAGTIYFGVMETALDSDQAGTPVMAQIVSGPFSGAKLMGTFLRQHDKLVIQFNRMSMPQWSDTIGINAFAIDAKTANNALATSVNHHYLLRYGMLFASAFLEGFGNAYQSFTHACPPGTASCNIVDSNGLQNNNVTATTAAYQGLGQVGNSLGQTAQQVFNTPPTVKVAQGTGIGVLFMSDVSLTTE